MNTFEIFANGTNMGEYQGNTEAAAVDAFAEDAGYDSFSDLLQNVPGSSRDDLDVCLIRTEDLCAAVEKRSGRSVLEDSYGNGVAVVNDVSYDTYRMLTEAYGLDLADFYA